MITYKIFPSLPPKGRLHSDEHGGTSTEFALSILVALVLILGVVEYCSLIYTHATLADAASEGVRYLVVNHADQSGALTKVKQYAALSLHDTKNINVQFAYPDGDATPPNRVTISVSYSYSPYLSWLMSNPPTVTAFAEGRTLN